MTNKEVQKTKHTETPYRDYVLGSEGYEIRRVYNDTRPKTKEELKAYLEPIARLMGDFYRQKANAKFIVKAVNNYEPLLEALKETHELLNDYLNAPKYSRERSRQILPRCLENREILLRAEKDGE